MSKILFISWNDKIYTYTKAKYKLNNMSFNGFMMLVNILKFKSFLYQYLSDDRQRFGADTFREISFIQEFLWINQR